MLTVYCDESGGLDQPSITVAGYVSTIGAWENFDWNWKLVLAKYRLPYFHMTEFAHFNGPFNGWQKREGDRRTLLSDLAKVIHGFVLFGIACTVKNDVYRRVSERYDLKSVFGCAYALCGRDCVAQASLRLAKLGYEGQPIRFVFDDGGKGKGDLIRVLARDKRAIPIFEPALPGRRLNHPGLTPLQAADFAAYEVQKAVRDKKQQSPLSEFRKSLRILINKNNWWGEYKETDLRAMCLSANIRRLT